MHGVKKRSVYVFSKRHFSLDAKRCGVTFFGDVPAIDEIGFNHCVNLLSNGGAKETPVGQSSSSSWKAPASPMSMTGSGHYWIQDKSPSGCGGIDLSSPLGTQHDRPLY
jgi:hypothetical protein